MFKELIKGGQLCVQEIQALDWESTLSSICYPWTNNINLNTSIFSSAKYTIFPVILIEVQRGPNMVIKSCEKQQLLHKCKS